MYSSLFPFYTLTMEPVSLVSEGLLDRSLFEENLTSMDTIAAKALYDLVSSEDKRFVAHAFIEMAFRYMENFKSLQRSHFGSKKETTTLGELNQKELENRQTERAVSEDKEGVTTVITVGSYERKLTDRNPKTITSLNTVGLEIREEHVYREGFDSEGNLLEGYREIGVETSDTIESSRPEYWIRRMVYHKATLIEHDENGECVILEPEKEAKMQKGSMLSPSMAADIICNKFEFGLSEYRIQEKYLQNGLENPRQNINNWVHFAAHCAKPIYEKLLEQFRACGTIYLDESWLWVNEVYRKGGNKKSTILAGRSGDFEDNQVIAYMFSETKKRADLLKVSGLESYDGVLITDGAPLYKDFPCSIHQTDWIHVRRKFYDSMAVHAGYKIFKKLEPHEQYQWLKKCKDKGFVRLANVVGLINDIFAIERSLRKSGSSKTRTAVNYYKILEEELYAFFLDGNISPSSNPIEQAVNYFVIGRKNWTFCSSTEGAQAACILYTIVRTAIINGLNVRDYLEYMFRRLKNEKNSEALINRFFRPFS